MKNRYFTLCRVRHIVTSHQQTTAWPEGDNMARNGNDWQEHMRITDEEERAMQKDEQATADAEHAVQMMLEDDPMALMAVFHDNATEADLDAMDFALINHMKSLKEGEESPFYDAVVRIVKEMKK